MQLYVLPLFPSISREAALNLTPPCPRPSLPQQVQLIVQNALRLYSQDRTGLVDYALESGGSTPSLTQTHAS